ncbi:MAG: 2-dehydropantoate 2-reductase [Bacteroidota bacterium]
MAGYRTVIIGPGGVGGFFGARLHSAGVDVKFLARGEHYAAIKKSGLTVLSGGGSIHVPGDRFFDAPADIGPADIILFTVKSYDTEAAARSLTPMLHRGTILISLQNGIDNEEVIANTIPEGTVFGGVAYVYATITQAATITEWGGPKKIVFGARTRDNELRNRGLELHRLFTASGVDAEYTDDIPAVLWSKFIFISAVGGITALTRLTLGEILAVPESKALLRAAMEEALAVATAAGVPIPGGYVEDAFIKLARYDNSSRSSLYNDLANGRRLELDALSGTVVRVGAIHGVSTPIHTLIYAALLPYHRAALKRRTEGTTGR